ncbi:hypothetical protein D1872_127390 [compost metagenome]
MPSGSKACSRQPFLAAMQKGPVPKRQAPVKSMPLAVQHFRQQLISKARVCLPLALLHHLTD